MALIPGTRYPAQTDADVDYPQGKARNAGSFQDGTGTPLEKDWLNDIWGFLQALLSAGGVSPSGDPDKLGASQYLDSVQAIIESAIAAASMRYAHCSVIGSSTLPGVSFQLLLNSENGGFSVDAAAQHRLLVPSDGRYFMIVTGRFASASTADPTAIGVGLRNLAFSGSTRFSNNTSHKVSITHMGVRNMVGDFISVGAETATVLTADNTNLFVLKL